ncbi:MULTISPECIES: ribonuclease PH [Vagococcus]|uniref:ribonuclease PH n=1 Tax=Vagococcus TaxID=2737 RepID=UPI000E495C96|nr:MULTISPECIES: ribonuclease PH [Vagococcus]RHH70994.1 ribonuclease PH [Vagococcus sp. AM17-17]
MRHDDRKNNEMRKVSFVLDYLDYPEGSVFVSFGHTKVIVNATVEDNVPPFLRDSGAGWVTAEYSMLPRATHTRNRRESSKGKLTGRTMEIQRLIGRSLRSVIDLKKLGERSIVVDCDVIQADGGTRTASITGAFLALKLATDRLVQQGDLLESPITSHLAAISVGLNSYGEVITDLDYQEDSTAQVDCNVVMTEKLELIEIQGTGEEATFTRGELNELLDYAETSINELIRLQKNALALRNVAKKHEEPVLQHQLLIATKNEGKAKEFVELFKSRGYQIKTLLDFPEIEDIEETGKTFEENARLKAEGIANQLNCLVLADDSGLKVDALGGQPGVYSARYAGERKSDAANNAKLLHELTDVPMEERTAQFHCTLVLSEPGKESLVVSGELPGVIGRIPRGDNGFGYDPLFIIPETDKTMAEMTSEEKNQISHRAKALKELDKKIDAWLGEKN